ncbi:hypothetical protein DKX38_027578 [Salix brachista]|uniref:Protein kinase domain-containing protein n=1 Tax=Salix brachista TaxID=2182728 RepID=A0A5N5J4R5_9ROSI|nr:hypothetical protein DKX38_027578 [Salix brachista]
MVQGYVDADLTGDIDSRKSTTGFIYTYGGTAVSWGSNLQKTVSLSTTEAEYIAVSEAAKEMIWLQNFLEELGKERQSGTLHSDSQSAIFLAKNPAYHSRTKHISISWSLSIKQGQESCRGEGVKGRKQYDGCSSFQVGELLRIVITGSLLSDKDLYQIRIGKRSPGKPWIDWPTRLRIVKGVAKGLAYLYKEFPTLALPHGHLKSSNVLLDDTFDPLLTDYALVPVVNKDHSQRFMVAYKSPECSQSDLPNRKTDVRSLGILILEILTGKFPENYLTLGKGGDADLATWANSVVREEWTLEVFDMDMMRTKNCEGEMLKLLKIGMCCCEWNLERRWDLKEAVAKIEELKERDNDDWSNSYASEGEVSSSRAVTDDDFPFSVNS